MFVQTNTIGAIRHYMKDRLSELFSENEIRTITNEAICRRLNKNKAELIGADADFLSESDLLYFRAIVKRLLDDEPIQYILGDTEFYGLTLKTDKRALIPRPETEELVDWVIQSVPKDISLKVLDCCTGSGCIALALKNKLPHADVLAVDVSESALELAKENAQLNQLTVHFQLQDVLVEDFYHSITDQLDVLVSNPPYIPEVDRQEMHANVLVHEPHLALFVPDEHPLLFYKAIANGALNSLKKGGQLFFEIHERFAVETEKLLFSIGFQQVEIKEDLQGKQRMIRAIK